MSEPKVNDYEILKANKALRYSEGVMDCPKCRKKINVGINYCPYCRARIVNTS